ncbi:hypothetical protein [Streptomyces sp. bgisy027]|uniref:hypothetical protein n=1 Tax=Streptomyces sp. bgisy027 TaxID=3413770 RepID=UPI003D72BF2C
MSAGDECRCWLDQLETWRPGIPAGTSLRAAWSVRRTLPVRITGVDVVRIASRTWGETLAVLRERAVPCGPVLLTVPRACVELAVPQGTAVTWPTLPTTRCVSGAVVRWPAPSIHARDGLQVEGRTWLYPPMPHDPQVPDVTDGHALADAVRTALSRTAPLHVREGFRL